MYQFGLKEKFLALLIGLFVCVSIFVSGMIFLRLDNYNKKNINAQQMQASNLAAGQKQQVQQKESLNREIITLISFVLLGLAVLFAAVVFLLMLILKKDLLLPMNKILLLLKAMAEGNGDLSNRLQINNKNSEIGKLGTYLNLFVNRVEEMLVAIKKDTINLVGLIKEISHSADNIATSTKQQALSFAQLASSLQRTKDNANDASNSSNAVNQEAKEAGKGVDLTVSSMSEVAQRVNQITESALIITDIADQTNLLALNAAIEAARAGDQGKGFAVVSDEVRKLAERSGQAAKDIAELIKKTKEDVDTGVTVSSNAGERIKKILANISSIAEQTKAINDSTKEQTVAVDQTTAFTEGDAAASAELAAAANNMTECSNDLMVLLNRFKTKADKQK